MGKNKGRLLSFFITTLLFIVFLSYCGGKKPVTASFSFSINDVVPLTITDKNQEISVVVDISDLPSGDSYFRASFQKESGDRYFGYVKNDRGDWVEAGTLSSDCTKFYKVSDNTITSLNLSIKIGDAWSGDNGTYHVKVHRYTSSCSSYSASSNAFDVLFNLVSSPTPSSSPVLTPTPTPFPTPNPTQSTAVYTINKAKDNNDNPLSNVKIYIDDQYTGNYAEETYKFCDGCKCGSNKVDCGFGSHTFRLEKNGYDDWSKTENITAGGNLTVDPILSKNNPNTPTPTATKTPSPVKSKSPATELPDSSLSPNDDSSEEMVLGLRNDLKEEDSGTDNNEKKTKEIKKKKPPVLGGILVFFGLLSLGYAGFYLYKGNKVKYKDGENTTKIEKEENGK